MAGGEIPRGRRCRRRGAPSQTRWGPSAGPSVPGAPPAGPPRPPQASCWAPRESGRYPHTQPGSWVPPPPPGGDEDPGGPKMMVRKEKTICSMKYKIFHLPQDPKSSGVGLPCGGHPSLKRSLGPLLVELNRLSEHPFLPPTTPMKATTRIIKSECLNAQNLERRNSEDKMFLRFR